MIKKKGLIVLFSLCSFPQDEILKLGKRRQDLLDKLKNHQAELEAKRAESIKLKQKFKVGINKVFQALPASPNYNLLLHPFKSTD